MKKKICFVVSSTMTVNAFLQEPIRYLSKYYQVYVAVNGSVDALSPSLKKKVTVLPVSIERKISFRHDLRALFQLFCIFRKYNFHSVHSVTPKAGLLAMLAAFLSGVKIRTHTFTGQVWVTSKGLKRWFFKGMDCMIALFATNILVDSASQRQFLLDEKVVSAAKSSVLAQGSISGVDIDRFKPNEKARSKIRKELAIDNGAFAFLFIGRLNRDKGVLDLAIAFSRIAKKGVHMLIVGPDEAGIQKEMEVLLEHCKEQVHFIGFSDLPEDYMAAADVLCLPSYREGFGSVVIEAAAVGIPAIGSKIYGVEDAIADGYSGLLFPAGNPAELSMCMEKIVADNEFTKLLGSNARKRVFEQFTSEYLASAWLAYYQDRL